MEPFDRLGAMVEASWRRRSYDEQAFPEIAATALSELPPSRSVDLFEVAEWAERGERMPQQVGDSSFGQPPLTVFHGGRFFIEVLFWLEGTTGIHQHAFAGAFHVMHGSSIQSLYRFHAERRVNAYCLVGRVELDRVEYLEQGATRPIVPGAPLIHSVFHLDHPSVSVVLRTMHDAEAGPQYRYLKPSLALTSQATPELLRRRFAAVHAMRAIGHPRAGALIADLVGRLTLPDAIVFLEEHFERITSEDDWQTFWPLVEQVAAQHEVVRDTLGEVFLERRRQRQVVFRRRQVTAPDLRFFLALLLNVPRRTPLLELVRHRFPDRDPVETVLEWLPHVWDLVPDGSAHPLEEGDRAIVAAMLHGLRGDAIKARLREEYDDADVAALGPAIDQIEAALTGSEILRPLFTE
jgi:hypothetical protein